MQGKVGGRAYLGEELRVIARLEVCLQICGTPQEYVGAKEGMVNLILPHVAREALASAECQGVQLLNGPTYCIPPCLPLHHWLQGKPHRCQDPSHQL